MTSPNTAGLAAGERAHTKGRERPILFSAPMVRALLDGRKTQTRRIVTGVPNRPFANCHPHNIPRHPTPYLDSYCSERKTTANPRGMSTEWCWWQIDDRQSGQSFKVKYKPGDRLWVREAFQEFLASEFPPGRSFGPRGEFGIPAERAKGNVSYVAYRADGEFPPHPENGKAVWRSPIFMPRKFSRLTLTVADVRVQRLNEISDEDAFAEGVEPGFGGGPIVEDYLCLWNSIHGPFAADKNPWVAAYTFTVERRNIDEGLGQLADAAPKNPLPGEIAP